MNLITPPLLVTVVMMAVGFATNVAAIVVGLVIWDRWFRRR